MSVIIPVAGVGYRMKSYGPKCLLRVNEKETIIEQKQIIDLTRISDGELKRLKQVLTNAIAPSGSRGDEKVIEGVYKK